MENSAEPKLADAPQFPPIAQRAIYHSYKKSMQLLVAYMVLTDAVRIV